MTKQCAHCAFFMGLQRKQGETIQEGQQFDIRGTVDEFRHSINMYLFWKPGMEIYVSHVRRRQIPSYVFPDGYRRSRPSRAMTQHTDKPSGEDGEVCRNGSGERWLKRKKHPDALDDKLSPEKQQCISPQWRNSTSPEITGHKISNVSPALKRKVDFDVLDDKQGSPEKQQCTSSQQDSSSPQIIVHDMSSVSLCLKKDPGALDDKLGTQENSIYPNIVGHKSNSVSPNLVDSMVESTFETRTYQVDAVQGKGLVFDGARTETDCVKGGLRRMEADRSSDVELHVRRKSIMCLENELGCTSSSSVVTNVVSEGSSCEDVGCESVTAICEGNTGSSEGSNQGSNTPGSLHGDSCEADSEHSSCRMDLPMATWYLRMDQRKC